MTAHRLKKLQSEFCEFIMHGRNQGRLAKQLLSSDRKQSVQRLDVYRNAYFIRLEAALAHDFPACERILGTAEFARQAGDYVDAHPSTSPSLRHIGNGFAEWLRAHVGAEIADLASIEWAVMQVFDGPNSVPADSACMEQFSPEDWATLQVELVPTLTLLSLTSNADGVWRDYRAETKLQTTAARSLVISRNGKHQPNLTALDDILFTVLNALNQEASLAAVSEELARLADADEVPQLLAKTLLTAFSRNWVGGVSKLQQEHPQ